MCGAHDISEFHLIRDCAKDSPVVIKDTHADQCVILYTYQNVYFTLALFLAWKGDYDKISQPMALPVVLTI